MPHDPQSPVLLPRRRPEGLRALVGGLGMGARPSSARGRSGRDCGRDQWVPAEWTELPASEHLHCLEQAGSRDGGLPRPKPGLGDPGSRPLAQTHASPRCRGRSGPRRRPRPGPVGLPPAAPGRVVCGNAAPVVHIALGPGPEASGGTRCCTLLGRSGASDLGPRTHLPRPGPGAERRPRPHRTRSGHRDRGEAQGRRAGRPDEPGPPVNESGLQARVAPREPAHLATSDEVPALVLGPAKRASCGVRRGHRNDTSAGVAGTPSAWSPDCSCSRGRRIAALWSRDLQAGLLGASRPGTSRLWLVVVGSLSTHRPPMCFRMPPVGTSATPSPKEG